MTSFLEPLMGMWPNSTGMVPGWPPPKIVQMVLIGWISRFSKCNIQKCSCLKLQGPELSNWVVSIIKKSSTNIWWTTLVVLCKWLHLDPWPLTYSSGERPRALWALLFKYDITRLIPVVLLYVWNSCYIFDSFFSFYYQTKEILIPCSGVKILRSVLNSLSVNNRNNMFVTQETTTDNVFYLRSVFTSISVESWLYLVKRNCPCLK